MSIALICFLQSLPPTSKCDVVQHKSVTPYSIELTKIDSNSFCLTIRNASKSALVWDSQCIAMLRWNISSNGRPVGVKTHAGIIDDKYRFISLPPNSSYTKTIDIEELRIGGPSPIFDPNNPRVYLMNYIENTLKIDRKVSRKLSISVSYIANGDYVNSMLAVFKNKEIINLITEGEFSSNTIDLE